MLTNAHFQRYANDPSQFRADLLIDVDGLARRMGDVLDPWQFADFAELDRGLMRCNGRSTADARMRAYLERPRGHSKTTDLAVLCVWALAFAQRPIKAYGFAADRDQARLLLDAIATIVRLNPWLGELLRIETSRVVNVAKGHPGEGAVLSIEASDVASSYGILPDLIIADEVTHWPGDGSLFHSLLSSAAKRAGCMLVCISNAGFVDSWQHHVREAARSHDGWYFSRLDGPAASWMTPARLDEQRRMLPAVAFARLWLNQWSTGGGDALRPDDIAAAFFPGLAPLAGTDRDWQFVAGVDLGLVRDGSAVVVLGIGKAGTNCQGKIRLAHAKLWRPTPGRKIDLMAIESYVQDLDGEYDLKTVGFDPWQAEHLAQRLETFTRHRRRSQNRQMGLQPWMREVAPTAANLRDITTLTLEAFQDRRLQLYDFDPLRRDLLKLRVEEKSYGCRLTSPRDGEGHGDVFSAFAMALFVGHDLAGKRKLVAGLLNPGHARRPYVPLSDCTAELADVLFRASGRARGQRFGTD